MIDKYYDPNSCRYLLKEHKYEFNERKAGNKDASLDLSVGGKKLNYLSKYFDEQDNLNLDMDGKSVEFMDKLLANLVDISMCHHLDRVHRTRFMCHSCYHG